jgi:type IV pilus assembly protein PilQ
MLGFARRFALIMLLPVTAAAGELQAPGIARLHDVVVVNGQDATTIVLKTSAPAQYQAEFMDSPYRLVVDLQDTTLEWRKTPLQLSEAPLRQVRGSQYRKGLTRVVIEFTRKAGYVITEESDGLAIVVPKAGQASPPPTRSAPAAPAVVKPVAVLKPPAVVTAALPARAGSTAVVVPESIVVQPNPRAEVDRKPLPLPEIRVVQVPAAPSAPPRQPAGSSTGLISLDFKDADVVNLLRILAAESGKNIVIGDDVKGKMSITLRNVPWEQALEIILEARDLRKIEKGNVLRIITSDQLTKERDAVAKLEDSRVRAEEARGKADAEIRTRAAEAQIKEQEARQRSAAAEAAFAEQQARGPLREETIRLAYADPDDVAKTLQGLLGMSATGGEAAAAPGPPFSGVFGTGAIGAPSLPPMPSQDLLAKGISIRAHKPTNSIFIRHYEKDLERIKKLIRESLDVQLPQIKIEARLNDINRTDLLDLGIAWGGSGIGRDFRNVLVGQGVNTANAGTGVPSAPFNNPFLTAPDGTQRVPFGLPVSAVTGLPLGGNIVNLPSSSPGSGLGIGFGIIGPRFNLNLALSALETLGKTRSLSRPEIVTIENVKGIIAVGSDVPFATVSSAGTQVSFKDATLKLEVTPTVIREPQVTKIKMKLNIEDNSVSGSVPAGTSGGTLPLIAKKKAETEVIVKEGETLVIGGIAQRTDTENTSKVPLFGDIPVIGWLFKQTTRSTSPNRELVIFITPTVLREAPRATGPPVR